MKLSSDVNEWDDDFMEPMLYPEQMTRKELRHELEKHNYTNFQGANTFSLRKKLREFMGLSPDPNDGIGLGRRYQKVSAKDQDDDDDRDDEGDSEDHSDMDDESDLDDVAHDSMDVEHHSLNSPTHINSMELDRLDLEAKAETSDSNSNPSRKRKTPTARPHAEEIDYDYHDDDLIPSSGTDLASSQLKMDVDHYDARIAPAEDVSTDDDVNGEMEDYHMNPRQILQEMASHAPETSMGRKPSILDFYTSPPKRLPRKAHERANALIGDASEPYDDRVVAKSVKPLAKPPTRKRAKYAEHNSIEDGHMDDSASLNGRAMENTPQRGERIVSSAFPSSIDGHGIEASPSASSLLRASESLDNTPSSKETALDFLKSQAALVSPLPGPLYGHSLASLSSLGALSALGPALPHGLPAIPINHESLFSPTAAPRSASPPAISSVSGGSAPRGASSPVPAASGRVSPPARQVRSSRLAARTMLAKFTQEEVSEESDLDEVPTRRRGRPPKRQLQAQQQQQVYEAFQRQQLLHQQQQMHLQQQLAQAGLAEGLHREFERGGVSDLLSLAHPGLSNGAPTRSASSQVSPLGLDQHRANMALYYNAALDPSGRLATAVNAPQYAANAAQNLAPLSVNDQILDAMHRQSMALLPFLSPISIPLDATAAQYATAMAQQHLAIMAALQEPAQPQQQAKTPSPFTLATALPVGAHTGPNGFNLSQYHHTPTIPQSTPTETHRLKSDVPAFATSSHDIKPTPGKDANTIDMSPRNDSTAE